MTEARFWLTHERGLSPLFIREQLRPQEFSARAFWTAHQWQPRNLDEWDNCGNIRLWGA